MFPKLSLCLSLVPLNKNWLVPMFLKIEIRSYPSSEFVVANTLAKWKKLKPNEIDFSQKVVSRRCSVFNSLPARGIFWHLLITFANSLDPDVLIQSVWHPDGIEKIQHPKSKYGTTIKSERNIGKRADQNTLFRKYVIFEPPRVYF